MGLLIVRTPLPGLGAALEFAVAPALGLLLLATFLAVPLKMPRGEYAFPPDFMGRLLALNFLVNPIAVGLLPWGIFEITKISQPLLFAAALVLLAPCIDYVVVFCGLAGGAHQHLLRATPVLLGVQILAVPAWLLIYSSMGIIEPPGNLSPAALADSAPAAMIALGVVVPLILAFVLQRMSENVRSKAEAAAEATMVPLMIVVLFTTVAVHYGAVADRLHQLLPLMITYALYALVSALIAWVFLRKISEKTV